MLCFVYRKAVICPNRTIFCSSQDRDGFVPAMLKEILNARVRVKDTMKRAASNNDTVLLRILEAQQQALKVCGNFKSSVKVSYHSLDYMIDDSQCNIWIYCSIL